MEIVSPKQLPESLQIIFEEEFQKRKKYAVTAWLVWFFLGLTGAHRLYLNFMSGLIYLSSLIMWFVLNMFLVSAIFDSGTDALRNLATYGDYVYIPYMFLFFNIVFLVVDLFKLQGLIAKSNKRIEKGILKSLISKYKT